MTKPELRFMPMNDRSAAFVLMLPGQVQVYYVGWWYPPCNYDCLDCAYGSCRVRLSGGVFYGSEFSGEIDKLYGPLAEAFEAVEEAVLQHTVPSIVHIQTLIDGNPF